MVGSTQPGKSRGHHQQASQSSISSLKSISQQHLLSPPQQSGANGTNAFGEDVEKQLPGPGAVASWGWACLLGGFRKRKILQIAALSLGFFVVLGWVWGGDEFTGRLQAVLSGGEYDETDFEETLISSASTETGPDVEPIAVIFSPESTNLLTWANHLDPSDLLTGLPPYPSTPPPAPDSSPLSSLGHFADQLYNLGAPTYPEQLALVDQLLTHSVPAIWKELYVPGGEGGWDDRKAVWQTSKDEEAGQSPTCLTWKDGWAEKEGWEYTLLSDKTAASWVAKHFAESNLGKMWSILPSGILDEIDEDMKIPVEIYSLNPQRADTLRYLLMAFHGGIYSDTDTILLQRPSRWGSGARLWKDGEGWIEETDKELIDKAVERDKEIDRVLGRPKVVVGIEADVGEREDWADWWPRPIIQWTMASAPFHPIPLTALLRIMHNTAKAITWSQEHYAELQSARDSGNSTLIEALEKINVMSEPKEGGPLGVINWTGPSVWTDAVIGYLHARYGLVWTDLKGLKEPLRVGDVVILPVTGFSPGIRQFGAGENSDPQAMVEHAFQGSWKHPN